MTKSQKDKAALSIVGFTCGGVLLVVLYPILSDKPHETLEAYKNFLLPFFWPIVPVAAIAALSFFFGKEHVSLAGSTLKKLSISFSDPPTKAEIEQLAEKLNDLLQSLKNKA